MQINQFFEEVFDRDLKRNPERQTYLGIRDNYSDWSDTSDERAAEDLALAKDDLRRLRENFSLKKLPRQAQLSYRLFEYDTQLSIEGYRWRLHSYPVNQMYGMHSRTPAFLINFHKVDDLASAKAYISRLEKIPVRFRQLETTLKRRAELGIMPPTFVYELTLDDSRKVIAGAPFDSSGASSKVDSALYADVKKKLAALLSKGTIDSAKHDTLMAQAKSALVDDVKPAYVSLIQLLEAHKKKSTADDGVWKLPDGAEFYAYLLRRMTTTNMTPDEVHELGKKEVARIHAEMKQIKETVGFKKGLAEFFVHMRTSPEFYYADSEEGRAQYLERVNEVIDDMRGRLDTLFITKPKAKLTVKRVEAFREKNAGKAFYSGPAPDGSRPGTYYANLYRMADMPKYQLEALAYHEAIPGHHMQGAIAQELEELPRFRRFGGYTAYGEGWGLYSEYIPKEMGLYQDPYSDFGRLAMELWRACRLVVDTGMHAKKWNRQKAIDYLIENTPNPKGDVVRAIDRYIVMPGQATAYKIGMIKLLEMRAKATKALGSKFDIRAFHDLVLTSGPVPLSVLEELVDEWIVQHASKN